MIKTFFRSLFIFIFFILAILTFLLTPTGLKFSIDMGSEFLPGKLSYQKISGIIIGPITVNQLRYEDKQQSIYIQKLHFNWKPLDLLKKEFHISALDIQQLHLIKKSKPSPTEWNDKTIESTLHHFIAAFKNHHFPLTLVIDQAHIQQITLDDLTQKTHFQISPLSLRSTFSSTNWNADFFATVEKPHPFKIHLDIKGQPTHYQLAFSIHGDGTNWLLSGDGNKTALTLQTKKASFLNGTLQMHLKMDWQSIIQWQGQLTGEKINLSLLNPRLPHALSITLNSKGDNRTIFTTSNQATIQTPLENLHFMLTGNLAQHTLLATLVFPEEKIDLKLNGHLHHHQWQGDLTQFDATINKNNLWTLSKTTHLTADTKHNDIQIATPLCVHTQDGDSACFQGNLSPDNMLNHIKIHLHHLTWLKKWLPYTRIPSASLVANLELTGDIDHPNVTGDVTLKNGSIDIQKAHVLLNNITATLTGNGHLINFNLKAFSKNQPIFANGFVDLSQPDFPIKMNIISKDALIINTQQYKATVTSNLNATIKKNHIFLSGDMTIIKGYIHPNDFQMTTTLPQDIVFVGLKQKPTPQLWTIQSDINVHLGHALFIDASNINGNLTGTLRVLTVENEGLFYSGQVFVNKGTLSLYGQTLPIASGSYLNYSNSNELSNPGLNLKATKIIRMADNVGSNFSQNDLIVGVELHGDVKSPDITFFSNQGNLSQADILSYILLGYAGSTNTPGNTDFLLRALAAVNITSQGLLGKQNIASQIQNGLGLSELGVESDTTLDALGNPLNHQSSFVVGKHLGQNFYLRYSIGLGLQNPVNVFQLRYIFNDHWAIETNSSALGGGGNSDDGVDVLYTIHRD